MEGECARRGEGMLKKSVHGTQMGSSAFSHKEIQSSKRQTEKGRSHILSSALPLLCALTLTSNLLLSSVIIPGITGWKQNYVQLITCRGKSGSTAGGVKQDLPALTCNQAACTSPWATWVSAAGPQRATMQPDQRLFMPPDEMPHSVHVTSSTFIPHT